MPHSAIGNDDIHLKTMHDIQQQLRQMLDSPDSHISAAELDMWMSVCPYMMLPVMRYLQQNSGVLDASRVRRLRMLIAMHSADPAKMTAILDGDEVAGEAFYPPVQSVSTPSTESTIDTFLDKYGNSDPAQEALLTRLIFNPTPDYAQQLIAEAEAEPPHPVPAADDNSQDALIDRFIESHPQNGVPAPQPAPSQEPDVEQSHRPEPVPSAQPATPAGLSYSLARIYIKQQRYDRAREIISQLSLNNPEKSVYFADQLRFIDKLIRNQQCQSTKD